MFDLFLKLKYKNTFIFIQTLSGSLWCFSFDWFIVNAEDLIK